MRRYQRGVTFIGWVILMIPFVLVFYAGIRLTPVYLNFMKVSHTLDTVAAEIPNEGATADGIRNIVNKHFIVDEVDYPQAKDIRIARDNGAWIMEASYDDQAPLFFNASITVTFDKKAKLKGE